MVTNLESFRRTCRPYCAGGGLAPQVSLPAPPSKRGKTMAALFEDLAYDLSSRDDRSARPASPTAVWMRLMSRRKG